MLQHHPESNEGSYPNQLFDGAAASDPRIEAYLNQISAPEHVFVDETAAARTRLEMQTHLECLIDANMELGDTRDAAIEHALQQFGKIGSIKRDWRHCLKSQEQPSTKQALRVALGFNAISCVAMMTVIPLAQQCTQNLGWRAAGAVADIGLYALPAAAGLLTGLFASRRPMLSTLFSLLILMFPMMVIDGLQSRGLGDSTWVLGPISQLAIFLLCWIPVGCTVAGVTGICGRCIRSRTKRPVLAA